MPCQCNSRGALSKLKGTPPQRKIDVTSKSPVGDISVVTLIRTDTTLDHSQKAEKVCNSERPQCDDVANVFQHVCLHPAAPPPPPAAPPRLARSTAQRATRLTGVETLCALPVWAHRCHPSQRSLHNAPIFRLLLKVAVNGTHQCDFSNFCGAYGSQLPLLPTRHQTACPMAAPTGHAQTHKLSSSLAATKPSSPATRLCINLRLQHLSIRLLHQ